MEFKDKLLSAAEQQLLRSMSNLSESIAFCASGDFQMVMPGLHVDGVGEIALPVSKADARRLIKQSGQAPYGLGSDTIVDTDVRRVWQLEPDQFRLENPKWDTFVRCVANSVKTEFGIKKSVDASPYKLLVYEKGSFFSPHRDTEKANCMFATLIVCLPSKHKGGHLIVSHAGQSHVVDFSDDAHAYDLQYAAFYADCEHEVLPVTDGYRICLVYNLTTGGSRDQPSAPRFNDAIASATEAIKTIFDDEQRDMIFLPLMHQYTEAGLTPDATDDEYDDQEYDDQEYDIDRVQNTITAPEPSPEKTTAQLEFKGADRARTDVLNQAAARAGCRAFVALLTHWQSGYPDESTVEFYQGRYSRRFDASQNNDRAEFEEVFDETRALKHWHSLDGTRQPFQELSFNESDFVTDVAEEDRPYHQEVLEATGNEGASMERWYHQAVVVIWPESRHYHVLAAQGSHNSVPALHDLVNETGDPRQSEDCKTFAQGILNCWSYRDARIRANTDPLGNIMMRSVIAIGDPDLAAQFFDRVLGFEYPALDGNALLELAEIATWKAIDEPLRRLFREQKVDDYRFDLLGLVSTFGSLASLGENISSARKQTMKFVLKEVTNLLTLWEKNKNKNSYRFEKFVGILEPLVRGVCSVGANEDLNDLMDRIEANPTVYELHTAVIPATKNLAADSQFVSSSKRAASAVNKFRQYCTNQLLKRTEKEPQPPNDWRRSANFSCKCEDCKELTIFLEDKDAQVHRFARRKDLRQHLHSQIDHHRVDCDHVTQRVGSPHKLVCTKNQDSFDRDLKQYKIDCEILKELTNG